VLATFLLPDIPAEGAPRPPVFQAYLYLFTVQWVFLSIQVAYGLWRAGTGQPAVTRRRMRTIALGATTLSIVLVAGAVSPATGETTAQQLVTGGIGLLSAPMFLLGFAPPRAVVAAWRRKDEVALREAETGLIQALTPEQVAEFLLPRLAGFLGGGGAILTDREGRVLGSHALSEEEVGSIRVRLHDEGGRPQADVLERVRLERGWLAIVASPLAPYFGEDERKTLGAIGALTDMALARAELFERERQSVETMRDFVAIASHDLRTPIAVISGIGTTVREQWKQLSEEQRFDLVGRVEAKAQQLARLVEDLLTLSKIESGFFELRPEQLEVAPLVSELLAEFGERAESIDVEIPVGTVVTGDPDSCKRILRNYVTNAFNYGSDSVKVQVRSTNGWVELLVSDSGEGVPSEFVPKLFEKFARADKKMNRATQGTGLGLSIVRGLAKAMGGDAFYEPNRPSGAVFGVRMPQRTPSGRA
jgi:signal transduction histidine kinase